MSVGFSLHLALMDINTSLSLPEPIGNLSDGYRSLAQQALGLMAGQRHAIANAANLSALIYHSLPDLNWVGFYFLEPDPKDPDTEVLMVGPFQGKPACVRIEVGQGVCGTAIASNTTQRVQDVHAFEGHIACDPLSRSELVVPLTTTSDGGQPRLIGVLDIDSPIPNRFDASDQEGLEYLARLYTLSIG